MNIGSSLHRTKDWIVAAVCAWSCFSGALSAAPEVTPNFPNVNQTPGQLLSGLNAPEQGRTAIIAYHGGVLYTIPEMPASEPNSDFQVRAWNIADPSNPIEMAQLGLTPHPVDAHGYFKSGVNLVLGSDYAGEYGAPGPWNFVATGSDNTVTRAPFNSPWYGGYASRGNIFGPRNVGPLYWSYNAIGNAPMQLSDSMDRPFDPEITASWDHLGMTGVIGHPFIFGNLLIVASDQSRTGVAVYDISDRNNPLLLDVLKTGGPGGYWPELWGEDGELYIVFPHRSEPRGHGFQVVNATDPSNLVHVGDFPLTGDEPMYAQFQDNYAFIGSHKIDMRTYRSVLDLDNANVRRDDGGIGVSVSQFALPLGNLLVTGGVNQNQGMAIWAHQAAPDTNPPYVGFHLPRAGQTNYPTDAVLSFLIHETLETFTIVNGDSFSVRQVLQDGSLGDFVAGELVFAFDDILTFTPHQALHGNTSYQVSFSQNGIKDAAGNGMQEYSFVFSTGSSVSGNTPPSLDSITASSPLLQPNQSVTLTAAASDSPGDTLQYRFDFGDGSARTAWQAGNSSSYSYSTDGHYRVVAQVRDQAGLVSSASTLVTVRGYRPAIQKPLHSAPLFLDSINQRLAVLNPDNNSVTLLNSETNTVVSETNACATPHSITGTGSHFWLSCFASDELVQVDLNGNISQRVTLDYGSGPRGIVSDLANNNLFVALESKDEVIKVDANTGAILQRQVVGNSPRALALARDNSRLLVTQFISGANQGRVWQLAPSDLYLEQTHILPKIGGINHRDGTAEGKGVPNYVSSIALTADGQTAWLTATKVNTDRGPLTGVDLDQDNTVRTIVMALNLATGQINHNIDLDNSDSASHLAFSNNEDYLFVALQGNDKVMVLDLLALDSNVGLGSLVASLETGAAPQGVVFDAAGQTLWVKNLMGRSVSSLDLSQFLTSGAIGIDNNEISSVSNEVMPANILRGKRLFYHASDPRMSGEGYLSCASCHNDGASDGRVWDFTGRGEGLRNTTSLLGKAGTGQGNVHWTGNFDEIHDFENDIRLFFGGTGFLTDQDFQATASTLGANKAGLDPDLDALAAYVTSLGQDSLKRSPHRGADGSLTESGSRGEQLFTQLNCASCHSGSQFTDSSIGSATLHDVGSISDHSGQRMGQTLPGMDTPTLLGAWDNAPYFHDGSAAVLADVFSRAGGRYYPAENGTLSGAAYTTNQWTELNNDGSVRGGGMVTLVTTGDGVAIGNIDGGSGGMANIAIRYANDRETQLQVIAGNHSQTISLPSSGNSNSHWLEANLSDLNLQPGNNQIELRLQTQWGVTSIDEIKVSNAEYLTQAAAHRIVLAQPATDQQDLVNYILQLDVSASAPVELPVPVNQAPIAIASAPSSIEPGQTVLLNGQQSYDPENAGLTFAWQQTSGETVNLVNADTAVAQFTVPATASGGLSFELTVIDDHNLYAIASVNVTITAANTAPVARIIASNTTPGAGGSISLDGSTSSDEQGEINTYSWIQLAGTAAQIVSPNAAQTQVIMPTVAHSENLAFQLTVTDNQGASHSSSVSIELQAEEQANQPPIAQAPSNQVVSPGDPVQLDASASSDPESGTLTFHWLQVSGPTVATSGDGSAVLSFTAPEQPGELLFQVSVTDPEGATAMANTTVLVNLAPVVQVNNNVQAAPGETVSFNANTSYDPEQQALTFQWQQTGGSPVSDTSQDPAQFSFIAPDVTLETIFSFELTVTDPHGSASQQSLSATVLPSNQAPTATISAPEQAYAGDYIIIDGRNSSDPDGDFLEFQWLQLAGQTVDLPWPNAGFLHIQIPVDAVSETYLFQLTVSDSHGASQNQQVGIQVQANSAPVINLHVPNYVKAGNYIEFDASGSWDANGHNLHFKWQQTGGTAIELPWPGSPKIGFHAPVVEADETLQFSLTVTDDLGLAVSQDLVLLVKASAAPVIVAQTRVEAASGQYVELSAANSYDTDGDSLKFYWQQVSGSAIDIPWPESPNIGLHTPFVDATSELVFRVKVTDSVGTYSEQDVVLVVQANQAPSIQIDIPSQLEAGQYYYINAWHSFDPEGYGVSFLWQQIAGTEVALQAPNDGGFGFVAPNANANQVVTLRLTVKDVAGAETSADYDIHIIGNAPPVVVVSEQTLVIAGQHVVLDASASYDPEAGDLQFYWQQVAGESPSHSWGEWSSQLNVTAPNVSAESELTFLLKVTDNRGKFSEQLVSLKVEPN